MPTQGEKRRVVSFNLDRERDLFDLAGELHNFSGFVKRHLADELARRKAQERAACITVHLGEVETAATQLGGQAT